MGLFKKPKSKTKILFACVENSGRSQMAEAFFNKYAPEKYEAISGGTEPKGYVNPLAIQAMNEVGIDMSTHRAKGISEDMIRTSTKAVNMGCMNKEVCPTAMIPKMLEWNIEDPKDKPIEKVREIRDQIEQKIKELISDLD
ncbi:arsenate reductase ArsC [Nitrosopumilus sp.]|uniref:arsenate reductase ArsC n=1 Tax=Nitrosopumilus sp. TaxID=2024843 RepID=UPI00247EED47|nr:arsenate reductase ArsC [Nitrosopumilus sp.]MCV0409289.1 arsenate reductase ArsC [Nitrosopumilus sp.]